MPQAAHLIPAQPGTYVLIGTLKADQFETAQVNVVAWAMVEEKLVPVTVGGLNHGVDEWLAVLQPNGCVEEVSGAVYASQEEWKRAAVKRARAATTAEAA